MTSFGDRVSAGVKERLQPQVDELIESHCEQRSEYRAARVQVALGEMEGVYTPDEVDRLELALANVYEILHDQSAELARISAVLEFGDA